MYFNKVRVISILDSHKKKKKTQIKQQPHLSHLVSAKHDEVEISTDTEYSRILFVHIYIYHIYTEKYKT